MAKGRGKGSAFERSTCRELSLWWTEGRRDDIFWRSASSGGMATRRHKAGKAMSSQNGDVASLVSSGRRLIKLAPIELKRGYPKITVHDLIDAKEGAKCRVFDDWFQQARDAAIVTGAPYWLLITRRNQKVSVIWMPEQMARDLEKMGKFTFFPSMKISFNHRHVRLRVRGVPLKEWFALVTKEMIRQLARDRCV